MAAEDYSTRVLNRKPRYDYRNFRLADYITPEMRRIAGGLTEKEWDLPQVSDQGNTPHCVGHAELNNGNCEPVLDNWPNERGDELYYRAKEYDGEPGQENGSSTLSGVKAFKDFAKLENDAYAFATSLEDIKVWVLARSPVVTGTNWYYDMFYPDSNGQVHIGGDIRGGHEYLIIGYNRDTDMFHFANSWGAGFGINGRFYMSASDYERLLNEQGDACTMVEIPGGGPVPPPPTPAPGCLPLAGLLYKLYQWAGGK